MVIEAQLLVYSRLLGSRPMPSLVLTLQLLLRILLILLYHNQEISLVISQEWATHLLITSWFCNWPIFGQHNLLNLSFYKK